jgi:hypothetical protein
MNTLPRIIATIPEDHPDLALLIKNTEANDSLRSASSNNGERIAEGHYLRVGYLKYWGPSSIEGLKNSFDKTNRAAQEYTFELTNVSDYEVEWDDDRYWDASFSFLAHKKN